MSTFLQLLQFCSEEENLLPFGTELCSYAAWEVLIYCGRRRFPLSFISFRAMRNCGSLRVNVSATLTVLLSGGESIAVWHRGSFLDCLGGINLPWKEAFPASRYFYSVKGDVCPSSLFRLDLCGIMEVLMSTFLQQACR